MLTNIISQVLLATFERSLSFSTKCPIESNCFLRYKG
jgi:hypothetical protein